MCISSQLPFSLRFACGNDVGVASWCGLCSCWWVAGASGAHRPSVGCPVGRGREDWEDVVESGRSRLNKRHRLARKYSLLEQCAAGLHRVPLVGARSARPRRRAFRGGLVLIRSTARPTPTRQLDQENLSFFCTAFDAMHFALFLPSGGARFNVKKTPRLRCAKLSSPFILDDDGVSHQDERSPEAPILPPTPFFSFT